MIFAPVPGISLNEQLGIDPSQRDEAEGETVPLDPHSPEGQAQLQRLSLTRSSAAYGNYWALARWRWAQWERQMTQPDQVRGNLTDIKWGSVVAGALVKHEAGDGLRGRVHLRRGAAEVRGDAE